MKTELAEELKSVRLTRRCPCRFPRYTASLPKELVGATILAIGTPKNQNLVEGGGLFIDYVLPGTDQSKRLVLAFNDSAMWVEELD